ncbi:MAG: class II aldolase/adducin family protein [Candidatus Methylacidiphilales bacterium]
MNPQLFSKTDAEAFVRTGAKEFRYNRNLRITPGARDALLEAGVKLVFDPEATPPPLPSRPAGSPSDEALFRSPEAERLKKEICDIGRRIWMREYCDGNGGNISCRLGPDRFLVTPTGVSKGFMTPEMISLVDGKGNQLLGSYKRSSEFTTHLAIYETTPEAFSVCHAHPCHAGAFAIKQLPPPGRLIPELEVFVGQVVVAPYETPGSPEVAASIRPLAPKHQSIIMGLHGLICWGKSVEDAYFKMEITDAYCRTVILAQALPGSASIPCEKMDDLLAIKKSLGLPDNRYDLKPASLCEVDPWETLCGSHGCSSPVTPANPMRDTANPPTASAPNDKLVAMITDQILAALSRKP